MAKNWAFWLFFLSFLVRKGLKTRHNLSMQEARINKKQKDIKC